MQVLTNCRQRLRVQPEKASEGRVARELLRCRQGRLAGQERVSGGSMERRNTCTEVVRKARARCAAEAETVTVDIAADRL